MNEEEVRKVLDNYIKLEEDSIRKIEEGYKSSIIDLSDLTEYEKKKLKNIYEDRLAYIKQIKKDLLGE